MNMYVIGIIVLTGLVVAYTAVKNWPSGNTETIILADGTKLKFNRCACGKSKGLNQTVCYECENFDRCECGELKSKEQSFCSRCRLELQTEGRISRKPLLPY
jgi:hypothetical protein